MKNRTSSRLLLLFVASLLSGCAAVPLFSFLPMIGSGYEGYVIWKRGEATKYYAFDIETTYQAVKLASEQLKLGATLIKSAPKESYSLETKGNFPMHIGILPLKETVTTVVIRIPTFGDKHYVELFYSLIDDNLTKMAAIDKVKAP